MHYSDLFDAEKRAYELEQQRKAVSNLASRTKALIDELGKVYHELQREGFHQLAWERLEKIVNDLRLDLSKNPDHPKAREISIAITHIETAILWLKK